MRRAAGFTLLELMLVLVLIGIGTSLAVISADRWAGRAQEQRWTDRTHQELRRLRNKAVLSGRPVQAVLDFKAASLSSQGTLLLQLPERFALRPDPAGTAALQAPSQPDERLELMFYPDGAVRQARFALVLPSGRQQVFSLARISGRIERVPIAASR